MPQPATCVGASLYSLWTSTWTQAAAQTRDVPGVSSGDMSNGHPHRALLLHSHRPRQGPQQEHRPGLHHGLRWRGRLATHNRLFLSSFVSPVLSLLNAQALLLLFLSHLSITLLNIVVAQAAGRLHGWWPLCNLLCLLQVL